MSVVVDPGSRLPPFEQVRAQLAEQIAAGTLVVGERLPTVRQLASDLGIAANTVARAYRELEDAGLIETRGRGGTVVASSGDRTRQRAHEAARTYADTVRSLGVDREQALAIVRAALAN